MATRVSIQGYEGSFHQVAAQQFFGKNVHVLPCATFRDVIKIASNKKESDGGVMAIENSMQRAWTLTLVELLMSLYPERPGS